MITLIKKLALNTIHIYVLRFVILGLLVWVLFGVSLVAKVEAANITVSGTLYTDAGAENTPCLIRRLESTVELAADILYKISASLSLS